MTRVAIMGSGSWGTAFGMVLADAGSDVVIWGRDAGVAADINDRHRNDAYHPGIELPDRVSATTDPRAATEGASLVVLAVPAQVAARQPRGVGRRHRRRRRARQPHEGHRARHHASA